MGNDEYLCELWIKRAFSPNLENNHITPHSIFNKNSNF